MQGKDLVLANADDDRDENAIIFTVGHPESDYPKEMINQYATDLVSEFNKMKHYIKTNNIEL